MTTTLISRTAPLILSTLLVTACGGGGGGGGSDSGGSSGGSFAAPYVPDDCTAVEFNEYLPLAIDTSINYNDSSSGAVDCSSSLTAEKGTDIYSIAYVYAGQPLTFYISSSPTEVRLWGIDGPIQVDSSISVNRLRFNDPIIIRDGTASGGDSTTASANVSGLNIGGIAIDYTRVEIDGVYAENGLFGDGDLPIKSVTLTTNISYNNPFGSDLNETLTTTFNLSKGLGIVRHSGSYVDFSVNNDIDSITGLPEPIWFSYDGVNDPALSSASNVFHINGDDVSPDDYTVVNEDDINALGWLTVAENVSSTGFEVTAQYDATLDALTLPYSVEIIFEHNSTGERLSSNITITD